MDVCKEISPEFKEVEPGRFTACHLYSETAGNAADEAKSNHLGGNT